MAVATSPITHAFAIALVVCGVALPAPAISQNPAVPTLAPMLREVTPGVVNIAVRARGPSENPLLRDPFFRRFFDMPDMPEQPRETSASGSGVDRRCAPGLRPHKQPRRRGSRRDRGHHQGQPAFTPPGWLGGTRERISPCSRSRARDSRRCRSATATGWRSVTMWWRSAIRSALARPSPRASSARWGAAGSASRAMRTSSRPTPRSTPATRAARWSICAAGWSGSTPPSCAERGQCRHRVRGADQHGARRHGPDHRVW